MCKLLKHKIIDVIAKEKKERIYVFLIFVLAVLTLFSINIFNRKFDILADETRYYDTARSIYEGRGLVIHNVNFNWQKILYSLTLVPFFAIKDIYIRNYSIAFFNSLMIVSTIFPCWLIAKKINLSIVNRLIICLLVAFSPNALMSGSIMSENLFFPLFMWFLYMWFIFERNDKIIYSILLGFLCYILYLCKEIGVCVLIICIGFYLINIFKKINIKTNILKLFSFVCSFIMLFIIFKFTIFKGMGNTYNQTSFSAINSFKKILFLFYGFIYLIISFPLICFVFPVLLPFFNLSELDYDSKRLFWFSISFLVLTCAVISFTITVREDLYKIEPNLLFRYLCPIQIIFIIVFLKLNNDTFNKSIKRKECFVTIICYLMFFVIIFKGGKYHLCEGDAYSLAWYESILLQLKNIYPQNYQYYLVIMLFNVLIVSILALIVASKNKRKSLLFSIAFFSTFSLIAGSISMRQRFYVSKNNSDEIVNINHYVVNNYPNSKVLILVENYSQEGVVDLYYDKQVMNSNIMLLDRFDKQVIEFGKTIIKICDFKFYEPLFGYLLPQFNTIDFVLMPKNHLFKNFDIENLKPINELSINYWSLLVNKNKDYFEIKFKNTN